MSVYSRLLFFRHYGPTCKGCSIVSGSGLRAGELFLTIDRLAVSANTRDRLRDTTNVTEDGCDPTDATTHARKVTLLAI